MQDLELKKIKEKCQLFFQFLIEKGMPAEFFEETNRALEQAYVERNVKVLKAGDRDVDEFVRQLSLREVLEIKTILKEKLGIDFEAVDKHRQKMINKVLKRGKITTREEYDFIYSRMEEISADPNKLEEIAKIDKMLTNYGGT